MNYNIKITKKKEINQNNKNIVSTSLFIPNNLDIGFKTSFYLSGLFKSVETFKNRLPEGWIYRIYYDSIFDDNPDITTNSETYKIRNNNLTSISKNDNNNNNYDNNEDNKQSFNRLNNNNIKNKLLRAKTHRLKNNQKTTIKKKFLDDKSKIIRHILTVRKYLKEIIANQKDKYNFVELYSYDCPEAKIDGFYGHDSTFGSVVRFLALEDPSVDYTFLANISHAISPYLGKLITEHKNGKNEKYNQCFAPLQYTKLPQTKIINQIIEKINQKESEKIDKNQLNNGNGYNIFLAGLTGIKNFGQNYKYRILDLINYSESFKYGFDEAILYLFIKLNNIKVADLSITIREDIAKQHSNLFKLYFASLKKKISRKKEIKETMEVEQKLLDSRRLIGYYFIEEYFIEESITGANANPNSRFLEFKQLNETNKQYFIGLEFLLNSFDEELPLILHYDSLVPLSPKNEHQYYYQTTDFYHNFIKNLLLNGKRVTMGLKLYNYINYFITPIEITEDIDNNVRTLVNYYSDNQKTKNDQKFINDSIQATENNFIKISFNENHQGQNGGRKKKKGSRKGKMSKKKQSKIIKRKNNNQKKSSTRKLKLITIN